MVVVDAHSRIPDFSILRITEMYGMNGGFSSSFEADAKRYVSNYGAGYGYGYDYGATSRFGGGGGDDETVGDTRRAATNIQELLINVGIWIKAHKTPLLIALAVIVIVAIIAGASMGVCLKKSSFGPAPCPSCGRMRRR